MLDRLSRITYFNIYRIILEKTMKLYEVPRNSRIEIELYSPDDSEKIYI
jgi:hypothetical protein